MKETELFVLLQLLLLSPSLPAKRFTVIVTATGPQGKQTSITTPAVPAGFWQNVFVLDEYLNVGDIN